VLQATPNSGYHARGKYGGMFSKVKGKLWVDKDDLRSIQGRWPSELSRSPIGLFPARVLPGSHITMEQMRVGNGICKQAATHRNPSGRQNLFHKESHP